MTFNTPEALVELRVVLSVHQTSCVPLYGEAQPPSDLGLMAFVTTTLLVIHLAVGLLIISFYFIVIE